MHRSRQALQFRRDFVRLDHLGGVSLTHRGDRFDLPGNLVGGRSLLFQRVGVSSRRLPIPRDDRQTARRRPNPREQPLGIPLRFISWLRRRPIIHPQ